MVELRRQIGMVFQQPVPFPLSIYDNVAYGPRIGGIKDKTQLDQIVEESLKQAALWDEVKDDLKKKRSGSFRWSAAATLYCPHAGRQT